MEISDEVLGWPLALGTSPYTDEYEISCDDYVMRSRTEYEIRRWPHLEPEYAIPCDHVFSGRMLRELAREVAEHASNVKHAE